MINYTTSEKIAAIPLAEKEKLDKEKAKTVISNDAYAISEFIEKLTRAIGVLSMK